MRAEVAVRVNLELHEAARSSAMQPRPSSRLQVCMIDTTLGNTNSPPQHEVEHHGGNHQHVEGEEDDEQALGAGVPGAIGTQAEESW